MHTPRSHWHLRTATHDSPGSRAPDTLRAGPERMHMVAVALRYSGAPGVNRSIWSATSPSRSGCSTLFRLKFHYGKKHRKVFSSIHALLPSTLRLLFAHEEKSRPSCTEGQMDHPFEGLAARVWPLGFEWSHMCTPTRVASTTTPYCFASFFLF